MYAIINVVGPFLLLAVLIYVTVRTWKRKPGEVAASEEAAKDLREQLNKEDIERPDGSR